MKNAIAILALLAQDPPSEWIVAADEYSSYRVRIDGTETVTLRTTPAGCVAPGGKRVVSASSLGAGQDRCEKDAEIWIADVASDGTHRNSRKLTDNEANDTDPSWSPDGRTILFVSEATGAPQVWTADAENGTLTQLTTEKEGARQPRYSAGGKMIAYLARVPENVRTKLPVVNLLLRDGKGSRVFLEGKQILDYSWSPDGAKIAVSLPGLVTLYDVEKGAEIWTIEFARQIDKRLHAHGARSLVWKSDGSAIACAIHFLGGREEGTRVFGDTELFVLPMKGEPRTIAMKTHVRPVAWESDVKTK